MFLRSRFPLWDSVHNTGVGWEDEWGYGETGILQGSCSRPRRSHSQPTPCFKSVVGESPWWRCSRFSTSAWGGKEWVTPWQCNQQIWWQTWSKRWVLSWSRPPTLKSKWRQFVDQSQCYNSGHCNSYLSTPRPCVNILYISICMSYMHLVLRGSCTSVIHFSGRVEIQKL